MEWNNCQINDDKRDCRREKNRIEERKMYWIVGQTAAPCFVYRLKFLEHLSIRKVVFRFLVEFWLLVVFVSGQNTLCLCLCLLFVPFLPAIQFESSFICTLKTPPIHLKDRQAKGRQTDIWMNTEYNRPTKQQQSSQGVVNVRFWIQFP